MSKTAIQWSDVTDNIIVAVDAAGERHGWWCRKISPGCAHCYSETINGSDYFHGNHLPYSGQPPVLKLREDIIDSWRRQTKPKKHFVMSMSDAFGEWLPQSWIFRMLDGMAAAPRQIFQVLTKRADVMLREVMAWLKARGLKRVPPNIWLGVSVENQHFANERIPLLLRIPCDVLFLSVEPLLDDVDLTRIEHIEHVVSEDGNALGDVSVEINALAGTWELGDGADRGTCNRVTWVINGGESGPGARALLVRRVRKITRDCLAYGVALFNKQLGAVVIDRNDAGFEGEEPDQWPEHIASEDRIEHIDPANWQGAPVRIRLRDHRHGANMDEWPPDLRIRQFPNTERHANAEKATAITEHARPESVPTTDSCDIPSNGSSTISDSSPTADGEAAANVGAAATYEGQR